MATLATASRPSNLQASPQKIPAEASAGIFALATICGGRGGQKQPYATFLAYRTLLPARAVGLNSVWGRGYEGKAGRCRKPRGERYEKTTPIGVSLKAYNHVHADLPTPEIDIAYSINGTRARSGFKFGFKPQAESFQGHGVADATHE